jgi:hypothetical protein
LAPVAELAASDAIKTDDSIGRDRREHGDAASMQRLCVPSVQIASAPMDSTADFTAESTTDSTADSESSHRPHQD